MKAQNYRNHRMFYPLHHFIFLPGSFILLCIGLWQYFKDTGHSLSWGLFAIAMFMVFLLSLMLRQHYALGLQNRIVRLEFKQRYFELYGKRSGDVEQRLQFSQIAALRFAEDDEFKILLDRALNEKMSGDGIKKAISRWRADHHRI